MQLPSSAVPRAVAAARNGVQLDQLEVSSRGKNPSSTQQCPSAAAVGQARAGFPDILNLLLPPEKQSAHDSQASSQPQGNADEVLAGLLPGLQLAAPTPQVQAPKGPAVVWDVRNRGLPAYDPIRLAQSYASHGQT